MPVLIDNSYTSTALSPAHRSILEYFSRMPSASSTTISWISKSQLNLRIHDLLEDFEDLGDNWDADDAAAPSSDVLCRAKRLVQFMDRHGQLIFHAAPGPNGEIMFDLRDTDRTRSMEIILYSDREVIVQFPSEGLPHQQDFDASEISTYLAWLNQSA